MGNNISRNGKSGIGYEGAVVAGSGYHYKDNIINDNAEFGIEITAAHWNITTYGYSGMRWPGTGGMDFAW
ncbi:hypothetical protein [Klebsiella pneumoniae]|uniref:hypothetical protein n=1 Tax=Klebsiella pneumoniae TaxID=573 RepID=UPI001013D0BB|nr:hypothetical protein [Klebsiella pneumoniae]